MNFVLEERASYSRCDVWRCDVYDRRYQITLYDYDKKREKPRYYLSFWDRGDGASEVLATYPSFEAAISGASVHLGDYPEIMATVTEIRHTIPLAEGPEEAVDSNPAVLDIRVEMT